MEVSMRISAALLIFSLLSLLLHRPTIAAKSYIVYFGKHSQDQNGASLLSIERKTEYHYDFLGSVIGEQKARDAIFYSYTASINGFAAMLDDDQVAEISKRDGVVSVIPNRAKKLHTTRSWDFLGQEKNGVTLSGSLWKKARFGEDTIIGNIDTGVWPDSQSFNDDGMGPIPSRWKGTCDPEVRCNRKLIGVRSFQKGFLAAEGSLDPAVNTTLDTDGHGTHTLSTAAGRFVPNASLFGYGNGTAKGGSPKARVAAYKVCWPTKNDEGGCFDADILAAFDQAITDGVDVLSVSLGSDAANNFFDDGTAIGSFHAVKHGIAVVLSAGNSGPQSGSVANFAPWMLTAGASTMDREFTSYLALGNKHHIKGQSLSVKSLKGFKPMISAADAAASGNATGDAQICLSGSLDPSKVKGKIVVCLRGNNTRADKGFVVLEAGGAGMVLANDEASGDELIADAHVLPATHITYSDGVAVFAYLKSAKSPWAFITRTRTNIATKPAPIMAAFSSQGPNPLVPGILKPDITAPGVSVLAAYSGMASPTALPQDHRRVPFNTDSGTSMSCPHVAGIAGLLKTLYPHWSPSAIKSAIMTTAMTQDSLREPIKNASFVKATPFNYGSGHVHPNRAMDPGLVYDLTSEDYLNFLCTIGYNPFQMAPFNDGPYFCPSNPPRLEDLNYPSITVPNLVCSTTVSRVLKNVGSPGRYKVHVKSPPGVVVSVRPKRLTFEKVGEEKKFEVTLKVKKGGSGHDYVFGMLRWSDKNRHHVRSPIVVKVGSK